MLNDLHSLDCKTMEFAKIGAPKGPEARGNHVVRVPPRSAASAPPPPPPPPPSPPPARTATRSRLTSRVVAA